MKPSDLSVAEIEILGLIKNLTKRKAYGKVEIVIRAGELTHCSSSETIVLEGNGRTKTDQDSEIIANQRKNLNVRSTE